MDRSLTCVPLEVEVGEDVCDGQDSDCDGRTDEDFDVTATRCGRGVCQGVGNSFVERGVRRDTCSAVTMPSPEVCDGLDNCDGESIMSSRHNDLRTGSLPPRAAELCRRRRH